MKWTVNDLDVIFVDRAASPQRLALDAPPHRLGSLGPSMATLRRARGAPPPASAHAVAAGSAVGGSTMAGSVYCQAPSCRSRATKCG